MRIALAQINPTVGDLQGNAQKIVEYVRRAYGQGADLVVFPELALCGYPPEDLLHKDHFVKDNIIALRQCAKKIKNIQVIVGFVDVDKRGRLYNAAALIKDGKVESIYHKQHLPNYGVFDEKRYFVSGNKEMTISIQGVNLALSICEDIWADTKVSSKKTDVIINVSSSPYDLGKLKERLALLKKRAKEHRVYVCYVNLVGGQDELVFDGGSVVIGPKGKMLALGNEFDEDLVLIDIPLGIKGRKNLPVLAKTKIKTFLQIERVYHALVLGTHDYVKKNGFKKVLVGLSGGIDSAVVAAIAVKAIGRENVFVVTMPSRYTSKGTRTDAHILSKNLGVNIKEIPIEPVFDSYNKLLSQEFEGLKSDATEENIQARIRGNILMALSNKFGWLVLTTGNKSEFAVGYCTLYGDMSGGFAVIKDVPKTIVYHLAEFINKEKDGLIPQSIITRAPSAELALNQKDQDSLPKYENLDAMLKEYVENHKSLAFMSKSRKKEEVKRIIALIDRNEYKRRQAPPGIKITPRAFGRDWRLPITNKYREF